MIRKEDVADLREGDVVEMSSPSWPDGTVVRGPVTVGGPQRHYLGPVWLDEKWGELVTLTVVSRAPRLYVNHPRTEPVAGDIVRNDEDPDDRRTWMFRAHTDAPEWTTHVGRDGPCNVIETHQRRPSLPRSLRLLVDGETGMTVLSGPRPDVSKNDPTPEWANTNPGCAASHTPFLCTREPGHPGQHVAGTGVGNPVAAVWR